VQAAHSPTHTQPPESGGSAPRPRAAHNPRDAQARTGDEAPFLEFIQRVCKECRDGRCCEGVPVKPGCGGFGIRNFLTLFLSIEVPAVPACDSRSF
jgi:hypothetical protein